MEKEVETYGNLIIKAFLLVEDKDRDESMSYLKQAVDIIFKYKQKGELKQFNKAVYDKYGHRQTDINGDLLFLLETYNMDEEYEKLG